MLKRVLAAAVLLAFALGSALFWADGTPNGFNIGTNLFFAAIGFLVLHIRWRRRDTRKVTPKQGRDIFS